MDRIGIALYGVSPIPDPARSSLIQPVSADFYFAIFLGGDRVMRYRLCGYGVTVTGSYAGMGTRLWGFQVMIGNAATRSRGLMGPL